MKRVAIVCLCVAMLACATACFKSEKTPEPPAPAPTAPTTAPSAAVSTMPTVVSTGTTAAVPGSLTNFPCVGYATDSLNIRRDASTNYDAVGGLQKGDKVTIVGEEGDFYKIEWSSFDGNFNEKYAYVSKQYVSASPNGNTSAFTTALGSTPTVPPTQPTQPTKPAAPIQ